MATQTSQSHENNCVYTIIAPTFMGLHKPLPTCVRQKAPEALVTSRAFWHNDYQPPNEPVEIVARMVSMVAVIASKITLIMRFPLVAQQLLLHLVYEMNIPAATAKVTQSWAPTS